MRLSETVSAVSAVRCVTIATGRLYSGTREVARQVQLINEAKALLPNEKRSIKSPTRRYPAPAQLT